MRPDPLPPGWAPVSAERAQGLAAELGRELRPGHPLHGARVAVVAAAAGSDDVLLAHLDAPGRYTVVHLTWTTTNTAGFPSVEVDGDAAAFRAWAAR